MYRRIDLTKLEGLDFTQDSLDFMQMSYRDAISAMASMMGDLVLVTGCIDQGASYSAGWVAINGELLPFEGGIKASNVIINEVISQESYNDGTSKDAYYVRTAKLANSGGNPFASFKRLRTLKQIDNAISQEVSDRANADSGLQNALQTNIDNEANARSNGDANLSNSKVSKSGDSMTGNLSVPDGTSGSHAVNKNQLGAVSVVAGSAQTTANNAVAAASAADSNANGRVSKGSDVMTGHLEMQGGWRTQASGSYFKIVKVPLGDWNMDANATQNFDLSPYIPLLSTLTGKIFVTDVVIFSNIVGGNFVNSPLCSYDSVANNGTMNGGILNSMDTSFGALTLYRKPGGKYDNANYDAVGYNRGFVTIIYEA